MVKDNSITVDRRNITFDIKKNEVYKACACAMYHELLDLSCFRRIVHLIDIWLPTGTIFMSFP